MALPNGAGKRFIRAKLLNDATLAGLIGSRVYEAGLVPQAATMPYVTYQFVPGMALNVVGGKRFWNEDIWDVKCIGLATQMAVIEQVADRVDDLLSFTSGETSKGQVVSLEHLAPIDYPENTDGQMYKHLGAQYRAIVQAGVTT